MCGERLAKPRIVTGDGSEAIFRLRIRHATTYRYPAPVEFGEWRLLLRPMDTHAVRVVEANLTLTPPGRTRWTSDAYSNSVCHFLPGGPSDTLQVTSTLLIERYPKPLQDAASAPPPPAGAIASPIVYCPADALALAPYITPFYLEDRVHEAWLHARRWRHGEPALDLLLRLNTAISRDFAYGARDQYGAQSPAQTLLRGAGACRDFAWLMIESVRRWGFAARFVTGYLYAPGAGGARGAGATHAWCEVFLPDLGWIEFDPTNGLSESPDLIRVAATRTPAEASPVSGVVLGGALASLDVSVLVEPDREAAPFTQPAAS